MKFSLNEPRVLAREIALAAVSSPLILGSPAAALFAEVGVELRISPDRVVAEFCDPFSLLNPTTT